MCKFCENVDEYEEYDMDDGGTICESCLEKLSDLYYMCYECEKIYSRVTNPPTEVDDELYCKECRDEKFTQCQDCGEWFENDDDFVYDGNPLCPDCYYENYTTCEYCGKVILQDDAIRNSSSEYEVYCESCANNYLYRCENCGKYFQEDDVYHIEGGNYYVCIRCFDHGDYTTCDCCGDYFHIDDVQYNENNGRTLCDNCYEKKYTQILSYHESWDYDYLNTKEDKNPKYFGFELEVSGDRDYAEDYLNYFQSSEVCLMNDSSIEGEGFEIITAPMTRNYFYETFIDKFEKSLRFLRENGFNSHNKGGLHIHISKEMVTPEEVVELTKVLYGDERDRNTWLQITQRHKDKMDRWSSMTNRNYNDNDILEGCENISKSRYTALNYDNNTETYEFRIFNGNIRIERFLKNFECILALIDYVKKEVDTGQKNSSTTGFLNFVSENKVDYFNLYNFLKERNIIHQHISQMYEDDLLEVA